MTKAAFSDGLLSLTFVAGCYEHPAAHYTRQGATTTSAERQSYLPVFCAMCGRPLKSIVSRERHLGPVCHCKVLAEADERQGKLFDLKGA